MLKRSATNKKKQFFLMIAFTLIGGILLCSDQETVAQRASAEDERCILCHVEVFNAGLPQQFVHKPFFERQCRVCHLPDNGDTAPQMSKSLVTGLLVDQQILWRKQQQFGGELSLLQHLVTLNDLEPQATYRFRLQLAEQSGQPFSTSVWLGLRLAELTNAENREILVTQGLDGTIGQSIAAINIQMVSAETVIISWETAQPLYSWLELQLLDEVQPSPTETSSDIQEAHPPLRDPERMAINACYQCHPESTLGTSHPVGLYSGRDVRIPDDLPTVDGMLTCVTCHDPHGSDGQMLVREVIKTKLCVTCHYKYKNSSPSTMFQ